MTKLVGFPDFFVVGAPRSGTTSLCRYLASNPQICFSRPKEPHYFAQVEGLPSPAQLQRDYIDPYFGHRTEACRVAGEGSVSYLFLPGVIERILHFNPDTRFIALVRNPLDLLPSYHLRMCYLLQEDQEEFERAWELEETRKNGQNLPRHCLDSRLLMYSEVGSLGRQTERLFRLAGPEHAHIIVFDDFISDPRAAYRDVLDFLRVDYDGRTSFEHSYESRIYRYRWLQQVFFLPAAHSGKALDTLQRRKRKYNPDGSKKKDWIKRISDWNKVSAKPKALSAGMRDLLREEFRSDVELLSRLLGKDLGHWLEAPS